MREIRCVSLSGVGGGMSEKSGERGGCACLPAWVCGGVDPRHEACYDRL